MISRSNSINSSPIHNKQHAVLATEKALLQGSGPSLSELTHLTPPIPLFEQHHNAPTFQTVVSIKTDSNSNIRMLYYSLLIVCSDKCSHSLGESYSQGVLSNFKRLAYRDCGQLTRFSAEEIPEMYRPYYQDRTLRKLMAEFLSMVKLNNMSVLSLLNRHPIIDLVMVLLMRSLLGSSSLRYTTIKTQLLANYFHNVIGLRISQQGFIALQGTHITLHQEEAITRIVRVTKQHPNIMPQVPTKTDSTAHKKMQDQLQWLRQSGFGNAIILGAVEMDNEEDGGSVGESHQSSQEEARRISKKGKDSLEPLTVDSEKVASPSKKKVGPEVFGDGDILVIPKRIDLTEEDSENEEEHIVVKKKQIHIPRQMTRLTEEPPRTANKQLNCLTSSQVVIPRPVTEQHDESGSLRISNSHLRESLFKSQLNPSQFRHREIEQNKNPPNLNSFSKFQSLDGVGSRAQLRQTMIRPQLSMIEFSNNSNLRNTVRGALELKGLISPKKQCHQTLQSLTRARVASQQWKDAHPGKN